MRLSVLCALLLSLGLLEGCGETFSEQYCKVRVRNNTSNPISSVVVTNIIDYHMDSQNREETVTTNIADLAEGDVSDFYTMKCSKRTSSIFSPGYSLTYNVTVNFVGSQPKTYTAYHSKWKVITSSSIGSIERDNSLYLDGDKMEIVVTDTGATSARVN